MSDPHLADRARRAEKIIQAAENYKICEGCESIVARNVSTCPSCHGYRFNEDLEQIKAHAGVLASRPQTTVTGPDYE